MHKEGEVNAANLYPLSFQKMELALVPLSAHGNFYEGDCYIILSVSTILPIPVNFSPESQFLGFVERSADEGRK